MVQWGLIHCAESDTVLFEKSGRFRKRILQAKVKQRCSESAQREQQQCHSSHHACKWVAARVETDQVASCRDSSRFKQQHY